jgi:MoxR-like ATPase
MQLVADRFIVDACGRGVDLATSARVCVRVSNVAASVEQSQWAERCAWLSTLVHPFVAPLLDYGPIGETKRFEAWEAIGPWSGSTVAARTAVTEATRFLQANGLMVAELEVVACSDGRARTIAGDLVGLPGSAAPNCRARDEQLVPGIARPAECRLEAVGEMMGTESSGRIVAFAVWTPEPLAAEATIRQIARIARLSGYVPVAAPQHVTDVSRALAGRTVVLIARDAAEGWRCAVNLSLVNSKPHIVVFAGATAVRRVHTIRMRPLSLEGLIASVQPGTCVRVLRKAIVRAARRSGGWLHQFERLLLTTCARGGRMDSKQRTSSSGQQSNGRARAAEQVAVWTVPEPAPVHPPSQAPPAWSAPGEIVRLRRQFASAQSLLENGRRQPAERVLRQVMHAFARRGEWREAADSALLLTGSLLGRGRVAGADAVLHGATPWVESARDVQVSQRAGILRGQLLLEQGRATESESVLETALASAVSLDTGIAVDAGLALVRCLYWQGRYRDAWQRLTILDADVRSLPRDRIRVLAARSRVALGLERVADAVAQAAMARDLASTCGDRVLMATTLYACALAQLSAGDRVQADAAAAQAADAVRRANSPMLALLIRTLRAEIARRHGNRAPAAVLVRRLSKVPVSSLPATASVRVELLREALGGTNPTAAADARAQATGLHALRLFAPTRPTIAAHTAASPEDIADLLRCCQVAEEDAAVLAAVCGQLRRRLQAAAVAFFALEREDVVWVAGEGARIDKAVPARIVVANQLVLPYAGERVEAGVPVRYAGRVAGVLVCTWTPGAPCPAADVSLLLSVGATAAGPALSGLVARRSADLSSRTSDLLGVSTAIADVRMAIERAALAPFAVLVEGESGSGKELVARMLHKLGPRRERPFCTLNCAALPEDLVESELFGHARGAFTGAASERRGVFEDAHGGTLFLDEIGELSARAQAKLLRAIQEGEIRRVGENVCRRVDVRLVTATNRDLRAEVAAGRFRADLLYRLDVIRIALPPLRDRREDIPVLAEHYWRDATARIGSRASLGAATLAALAVRCARRGIVPSTALPPHLAPSTAADGTRLDAARRQFDRAFICAALARAGGQRTRAAEQLGLSRQGLAKLMARLGIEAEGG